MIKTLPYDFLWLSKPAIDKPMIRENFNKGVNSVNIEYSYPDSVGVHVGL